MSPEPVEKSEDSRIRRRVLRLLTAAIVCLMVSVVVFEAIRPDKDLIYVQDTWSVDYGTPDPMATLIFAILAGICVAAIPFAFVRWSIRKREREQRDLSLAICQHRVADVLIIAHRHGNSALKSTLQEVVDRMGTESFLQETASIPDPRLVVPLAEALQLDVPGRSIIRKALYLLLPRLDHSALPWIRQSSLYYVLRSPDVWQEGDADLVSQILQTVERICDGQAAPHVAHLASHAEIYPTVQAAAQSCLDNLRGKGVLLRPAQEPNEETLLRTVGPLGAEPDLLLRPGVSAP